MLKEKRRVVLASRNRDKIREMSELCRDLPFEVGSALDYPGLPEVIEDGTTELGNASRKAIVTAAFTGEISVADDTSLQVLALNNLPDIFASRFAGPEASYADNAALVLDLMQEVPDGFRQARFMTAAVWVDPRPNLDQAPAAGRPVPPGARCRWVHNPFARAIHVADPAEEARFFNTIANRRREWSGYRMEIETVLVSHGVDRALLEAVVDRLVGPFESGERPADAEPTAVRLPDPRIWTADGPGNPAAPDFAPPPTLVTPTGLPADAPGREENEAVWLELATVGRLLGEITRQPHGSQGFGYDPIFRIPDSGRTLAEFAPAEKNAVSHRGRALRRLVNTVRQAYLATV